jgi:hypothetical protein
MTEAEIERVAELQLGAFLAGRGSVTSMRHGTRTAKPAPTMDDFRNMAKAAIAAMPPCNCTAEIVGWLRDDAGKTRADISRLHANHLLTEAQTKEWELLLEIKTGIASAIERGDWKSHD